MRALALALLLALTCSEQVWAIDVTAGGNVPSGGSIIVTSGACPGGYTEDTTMRGRFLIATPAGGTVGGTYGSAHANVTAPTFAGSALANHQHIEAEGLDDANDKYQLAATANPYGSSAGTGSTRRSMNPVAIAVSGNAIQSLTSATSAGTPAGTITIGGGQILLCKKS